MTPNTLRRIRLYTTLFILGLILSGITAFPLQSELALLLPHLPPNTALAAWIARVHAALADTNTRYPFLAYGTDWLAFAHLVIALAFLGLYKDPARNRWLVTWGILCCLAVFPLALIAGQIRGIPWPWRLLDCSFGILGLLPLLAIHHELHRLPPPQ
jgi:hypothetical protein